ncbi:ABC transporter ATP-binding protein/permease [Bacterioplanes sanyensis]|uniref:ABC transporter transmembrane domain-containing protein n=1 Tax=Bacterioplanes sanyensis TaxID=1249553 RepID=UPI00167C32BB|nr:ABC transporter transmembrane domain-containing protein [Bacterioplanes sanyensis]GGY56069.1 ABC transporter ATP-binding protein/permease [Bacterioplanes sanyensis]
MLRWLWPFIKPYRKQFALALTALIVTAALTLSLGQGVRLMMDQGFAAGSQQGLEQAIAVFAGIVLLVSLGAFLRFYWVSWLGERVVADIRQQLYRHLLTLPPSFFEDNLAGEIQSRVTTDTTLLQTVIGSSFSFAVRNSLLFVGGLGLMFYTNAKLSVLALVAVPLLVFPVVLLGRKVRKLSRASQDQVAKVGAWAGESLQHIKVVQAFGREAMVSEQFQQAAEGAFAVALKRIRQRAVLIFLVMALLMGSIAVMLYIGGTDVIQGRLTPGELAAFVFYALMVAMSLAAVTEVYGEVQRAAGAAERIRELLATEAEIRSPAALSPDPLSSAVVRAPILQLQQLSFAYPSRPDTPALQQVELHIAAGERVALVGPSGGGKSTLLDLLLRFRDPQQGRILLHGRDLRDWPLAELRQHFALVPQQPVLFSTRVRDNLRYGRPDASDEDMIQAAKAAHAHDFIQQLPDGYDSYLGEQGVKLSGGQKQRLAIARAILSDPEILLLDEATSALDADSEHWVQQALDQLMQQRTSLVIAHRLATVRHADRIVVLDQGRIAAVGTHDQLLQQSPLYQRLAQLQFGDHCQN